MCKGPEAGVCLMHLRTRRSLVQVEHSENEGGNGEYEVGGRGEDEDPPKRDEVSCYAREEATSSKEKWYECTACKEGKPGLLHPKWYGTPPTVQ